MTTVFLDPAVLTVGNLPVAAADFRPAAEAATAVRHLLDGGHRVVVVGEVAVARRAAEAVGVDPGAVAPTPPDGVRGWLVTADPSACHDARHRLRVRTVLVGPLPPDLGLAHRPADVEARDLVDAVLTILTADAMPDGRS